MDACTVQAFHFRQQGWILKWLPGERVISCQRNAYRRALDRESRVALAEPAP